jgi:long-chain acyl-CoA synthetase
MIEGYGLTESSAAVVLNPADKTKLGTVGKPLPMMKLKIVDDGELLFAGPNIMKGYWKNDEATAQVIDSDGYLHTGDIGKLDDEGYVKITDRKKDIIVLANGKNVAPQPIETKLKDSQFVLEVILLGDKSGTVSALVVPNYDTLKRWAKDNNIQASTPEELASSTEARKAVKEDIDKHSIDLADFEKIRRIALLEHALSIDAGELTPTHKVRRKVVQEKYGHLLD